MSEVRSHIVTILEFPQECSVFHLGPSSLHSTSFTGQCPHPFPSGLAFPVHPACVLFPRFYIFLLSPSLFFHCGYILPCVHRLDLSDGFLTLESPSHFLCPFSFFMFCFCFLFLLKSKHACVHVCCGGGLSGETRGLSCGSCLPCVLMCPSL